MLIELFAEIPESHSLIAQLREGNIEDKPVDKKHNIAYNLTNILPAEFDVNKTKLSSKGQIIIPKWLRELHNWQVGLEFVVIDTGDGILLKPIRPFPQTSLDEVAGCLAYTGQPKTLEEMDAAIEQAVSKEWHDKC